jgi:thiamine biosynthesis lipoprotein ApbE
MKKYQKYGLLSLMCSLLFSCGIHNDGEWISISSSTSNNVLSSNNSMVTPFNTVMSLRYFKNSKNNYESDFDDNLKSIYLNEVKRLHKIFDRHYYYKDENDNLITSIKTINDSYGTGEEIACSDELYYLMKKGVEYTILTDGYYNFFSGKLVDFWDNIVGSLNENMSDENLMKLDPYFSSSQDALMNNYAYAMVSLDEVNSLITFNDEKKTVIFNSVDDVTSPSGETLLRSEKNSPYRPLITPGGIAKGVATDYLKELLVSKGYTTGWLSSGTSSITLLSKPTFEEEGYQKISFLDPRYVYQFTNQVAFSIKLTDEVSLSTSGNYTIGKSYYFNSNEGTRIYRHHIVNPYTGDNPQYHRSVSIISSSLGGGDLDAISTALMNLSVEDGLALKDKILKAYPQADLEIIYLDDSAENIEHLNIVATKKLKKKLTNESQESSVLYV